MNHSRFVGEEVESYFRKLSQNAGQRLYESSGDLKEESEISGKDS